MANKINVKLILELRDAGMSRNTIASTRHISRNSVSDVIHIADEKGIRFKDVRLLERLRHWLTTEKNADSAKKIDKSLDSLEVL